MTYPPQPPEDSNQGWSAPESNWGSPDAGGYPPQPGQQYSSGAQYGPGSQQGPGPNYGASGGTPPSPFPPQPGIIPLQPLAFGQIFNGAISAIRANPVVMFVFAAILLSISGAVQAIFSSSTLEPMFEIANDPLAGGASADELDVLVMDSIRSIAVTAVVDFFITTILAGVLTYAVSQAVLGYKPSLGQVWAQTRGQIVKLLGLVLLTGLIVAVVPIVLGLSLALLVTSAGVGATALGILFVFVVSLLWALFVNTVTLLATPALMLEGCGPITALRRSWALTLPFFWRILGIFLLTSILVYAASMILSFPIGILSLALPPSIIVIATLVVSVVVGIITTPFMAGITVLLYIDVRIRREGLATELAAASARPQ